MMWQTLAPELIYEVLNECRIDSKTLSITKLHSFPWYLGHICRAWREVFVSSPQFWNTLDINLDSTTLRPCGVRNLTTLEVARMSIARSRDCPISFRLSIIDYSVPPRVPLCRQIIEILVANSARWFDAYIHVPATEMAIIYAAKNRMPLLRSMQLELQSCKLDDYTFFRSSDAAKLYSDFLVDATQLTRISFHVNSPLWKMDWSTITVAHFGIVPPLSQLLAYLSQTSCLTELVIVENCSGDSASKHGIVPITFPHLKSLYSPAALLPIFDTPALQELHIWNVFTMVGHTGGLLGTISRYFQHMQHLSKLKITSNFWEHAALIIEHMPRVDHLTLRSKSTAELLKIMEYYPQIGFLTTVTFILYDEETDHCLETITSWKRKAGENRGIGLFKNLTKMSFELLRGNRWKRFLARLKMHLEEQGMPYSISENRLRLSSCPRFDVL